MPKLLIPNDLLKKLNTEVSQAGENEIGGGWVGEILANSSFNLSISQNRMEEDQAGISNGTPKIPIKFLIDFFGQPNNNTKRFIY